MGLSLLPTAAYFFFDDDKALGATSEGLLAAEQRDQEPAGVLLWSLINDMLHAVGSHCLPAGGL